MRAACVPSILVVPTTNQGADTRTPRSHAAPEGTGRPCTGAPRADPTDGAGSSCCTGVVAGGWERPVVVGHSIGGALVTLCGSTHPVAGVVSVDAPIRLEGFAPAVTSLRDRFAET